MSVAFGILDSLFSRILANSAFRMFGLCLSDFLSFMVCMTHSDWFYDI